MVIPQQSDRRARHLLAASKMLVRNNPQLSAYLGSQLQEYSGVEPQIGRHVPNESICKACGSLQVPGLSCSVSVNTARAKFRGYNRPSSLKSKNKVKKARSQVKQEWKKELQSSIKITCHLCRRHVTTQLQKPGKLGRPKIPAPMGSTAASTSGIQRSDATISATSASEKKSRRKERKGGLAAMLAKAKAEEKSQTTGTSLGFSDLAKRR